jgi:hypothetical protein
MTRFVSVITGATLIASVSLCGCVVTRTHETSTQTIDGKPVVTETQFTAISAAAMFGKLGQTAHNFESKQTKTSKTLSSGENIAGIDNSGQIEAMVQLLSAITPLLKASTAASAASAPVSVPGMLMSK